MAVELHEEAAGKILKIHLKDKLTRGDYEHFVPEAERLIKRHGKVRLLVEMRDFHGWTVGALWQDIKFDWKHFRDIERVALVGDKAWEQGMATFCKPFTTATVRFFEMDKAHEADAWIHADLPVVEEPIVATK
jgi:hypothetical protein